MRLQEANCIMNEVHKRIVMSDFPTLLVGDFNIEAELLETCNILFDHGWKDLAELSQLKWGFGAEATCRGATRRTFALGDAKVTRFLHDVRVVETYQFDSHPVLKVRLNVAIAKYSQLVWPHPRSFDDHKFDDAVLNDVGKKVAYKIANQVDSFLQQGQCEQALQFWSQHSEDCLIQASETVNLSNESQYKGRCKALAPTEISISPPCVRHGRPGDANIHLDSANTRTRQLLRQTRRLKHLAGVIAKQQFAMALNIWNAIYCSPGFRHSFQRWVQFKCGVLLHHSLPTLECVLQLQELTQIECDRLVSLDRKRKRDGFKQLLEDSQTNSSGRAAFAAVKEESMPEITHIVTCIKPKLKKVRWSGPTARLQVENSHDFRVGAPLSNDEESWKIEGILPNALVLDKPIAYKNAVKVSQQLVVHSPDEMSDVMYKGWSEYWCRDPEIDEPQRWEEFEQLLSHVPSWHPLHFQPLDLTDWRYAITNTKARSMRGSCSWSAKELLVLPEALVLVLLHILNFIEISGEWPDVCMKAFVVCLAKTTGEVTWKDVRPITVASMIYRIWGRMRTHKILTWMNQQIGLVLPDVSFSEATTLMWTRTIEAISDAHESNRPCAGAVFDLIKAFNTFGRTPLKLLAIHLGLDPKIVNCWTSALLKLKRLFIFQGSLSREYGATTGVPEGCGMSVAAVGFISYLFLLVVKAVDEDSFPSSYADNWCIIAFSIPCLQSSIAAVADLCRKLRLYISVPKSWVWASHRCLRKRLKDVRLNNCVLPLQYSGVDLGADMRYSLRLSVRQHQDRVHKGILRLRRLNRLPINRRYKAKIIRQSIWPQSLHAAESIPTSRTRLHRLRSAAAEAIGHRKCSQNPWLALGLHGKQPIDPEFVLTLNRLKHVRHFAKRTRNGAEIVLRKLGKGGKYLGPIKLLRQNLVFLGWTVHGLQCRHSKGLCFNLLYSSMRFIAACLSDTWKMHVCQQIQHRKQFKGLTSIETFDDCIVRKLQPQEVTLYENIRSGALVTNDVLSKFTANTCKCPACNCEDSIKHRLMECQATAAVREKYSKDLRNWVKLPDHALLFGLFTEVPGLHSLVAMLNEVAFPEMNLYTEDVCFVFIDGTCCFPQNRKLRYAAWAITVAGSATSLTNHTIAAGPLPGADQCIFRAELLAGIIAVAKCPNAVIYSDCSSFVMTANKCITAKRDGLSIQLPEAEYDLWLVFWRVLHLVSYSQPCIRKVKAHQDLDGLSGWQYYLAFHNSCADVAAKDALALFPKKFLDAHKVCLRKYESDKITAIGLAHFHVECAHVFLRGGFRNEVVDAPNADCRFLDLSYSTAFDFSAGLNDIPNISLDIEGKYIELLWNWLRKLRWSNDFAQGSLNDMAWVEVVWLFHTMTGICLGVLPEKKRGKKRLALKSTPGNAALPSANIDGSVRLFLNAVKQLEKAISTPLMPGARTAYCKSFWAFGSQVRCAGIGCRIADIPLPKVHEFVQVVQKLPAKNPLKSVFHVN